MALSKRQERNNIMIIINLVEEEGGVKKHRSQTQFDD